jgi:hypothetical protein
MSSVIAAGGRAQLALNRSTMAAIIRAISTFDGAFSSRDMLGCEHSAFPLSGRRPTAILNTGSERKLSQSAAACQKASPRSTASGRPNWHRSPQ